MPFDPRRLARLLKVKNNIKQAEIARAVGVTQTRISECISGEIPSVELLEKFATFLDCTPDFLLGWSFPGVDGDDDLFMAAVSSLAFDVFEKRINVGVEQKERCRRVLIHRAAPVTADAWAILSEQIDLAIGQTTGGTALHVVRNGA